MPTSISPSKARLQVLIVGEVPEDAQLPIEQLSACGFALAWRRVETLGDFAIALSEPLDLILIHTPLAQLDAIAALQLLRSRQLSLPAIVIGANGTIEEAVSCIKHGATDYLLKTQLTGLGALVQQVLAQQPPDPGSLNPLVEACPHLLYQMRLAPSQAAIFDYISPAVTPLTGYEPRAFYADPQLWFQRLHREDARQWRKSLQHHPGRSLSRLVRFFDKRDRLIWLAIQERPVYDATGNLSSFVGAAYDASDRQQQWLDLENAARKYHKIFESANDAILIIDPNSYQILEVNERAVQSLGYTRDEFTQLNIHQISSVPSPEFTEILNAQKHIAFEHLYRRKDGSLMPVEVSYCLLEANGQQFYQSTVRDITERQQLLKTLQALNEQLERRIAERSTSLKQLLEKLTLEIEQRQDVESALRASEEKFRQLAENIHQVFWMTDCNTEELLYINPAYEQIWQRPLSSLYKQSDSWIDAVHSEDRERVFMNYQRQLKGEHIKQEYRIVHPDGSIRWLGSTSFSILNEQGQVYRIAGLIEDITERKKNEEGIHESLIKEKELNELKSRFVCMTSHEFRTPLSSILSAAELLGYYGHHWDDNEKQEQLQIIQGAVQHMIELLEDVLLMGRTESDQLSFNPTLIDLDQFCKSLIYQLQISEQSRYIGQQHNLPKIRFSSGSQLRRSSDFKAYLDEKLLRQILTNLLSNSLKYSHPSSLIELNLQLTERTIVFQIKDTGIGIPADEIYNLFEPFYRCSNAKLVSGTGLGLAIVKKSVDLHGGTIEVSSQINVGTTFTVTLPINYWLATQENEIPS
ncbi:MAG: PAS domain S-box protein [Desertifilum sp.]|nr:PAS domain S-box protein [Desertifilum sp.]